MEAERNNQEIVDKSLSECARLADVDGKRDPKAQNINAQLEKIERQLYSLIGQVRNLKTT